MNNTNDDADRRTPAQRRVDAERAGSPPKRAARLNGHAPPSTASPSCDEPGFEVLAAVEAFLARFVSYPCEHARVAHALWLAHAHVLDCFESTPRIAFRSPEPGSGKSRALEVSEPLVPRPVVAINCTPAYLFRKVGAADGRPTLLYDEIDTVFGPRPSATTKKSGPCSTRGTASTAWRGAAT